MPEENDPIFIVGVHRSGTTLLRYMLNSGRRIYIPPESDFFPRFFGRDPHEHLSDKRIADILDVIFGRYRFVKEWEGEPPQVKAFAEAMDDRSPAAFLNTLYGTYAQQHNAIRWGDKTPIYASYMDLIHEMFTHARFIHVIRDGRDVSLSMLDKWGEKEIHVDQFFAARNWVRRIKEARLSGSRLPPEQYYEVRYESLVANPEQELRALCDYLDEPYTPQMAEPQILGRQAIGPGGFHAPVRRAPNTSRIGRWHTEMPVEDQRLFQSVAGGLLVELGYEPVELGSMPVSEILRLGFLGAKYAVLQAGRKSAQTLVWCRPSSAVGQKYLPGFEVYGPAAKCLARQMLYPSRCPPPRTGQRKRSGGDGGDSSLALGMTSMAIEVELL